MGVCRNQWPPLGLHADAAITDGITSRYEDVKCSHQDTRAECPAQGITFLPMVVEAVGGGWGKMARCVWSELAKNSALAIGELETASTCAIMPQQRLSMVLQREIARACLRRFLHTLTNLATLFDSRHAKRGLSLLSTEN